MTLEECLDANFKFKIGDVLIHRAALIAKVKKKDQIEEVIGQYPFHRRLFVTERHVQQCAGGIQKNYTVASCDHNGEVSGKFLLTEIELDYFPKENTRTAW